MPKNTAEDSIGMDKKATLALCYANDTVTCIPFADDEVNLIQMRRLEGGGGASQSSRTQRALT